MVFFCVLFNIYWFFYYLFYSLKVYWLLNHGGCFSLAGLTNLQFKWDFGFSFWGWGVFRDYSLVSNCVRNAPDVLMYRPWKLIKCSEKLLRTLHKKPVLCCVYSVGTVPHQCDCMRRVINIYS